MMIATSPVGLVSPSSSVAGWLGAKSAPWSLGFVGGLGLALALGLGPAALASGSCEVSGSAVQGVVPTLSPSLAQDVCHMVTMPTATRSEGEHFMQQIQPNSLRTETSASAETMTQPSLWWTRDSLPIQLGRRRLVDAWFSYAIRDADVRVVDVMINSQFWRALSLHQRYGVLAQFGTTAQDFGYHLRFFQGNGYSARLIGLYACEPRPSAAPEALAPHGVQCLITVDPPRIADLQRAMQTPAIPTAANPDGTPLRQAEASPAVSPSPQGSRSSDSPEVATQISDPDEVTGLRR